MKKEIYVPQIIAIPTTKIDYDKDRFNKYYRLESFSNSWDQAEHTSAAALYRNLSIVYDFYLDELGLVSFDGLGVV